MSPDDDADIPGRLPGHDDATLPDDRPGPAPAAEAAPLKTLPRLTHRPGLVDDPVFQAPEGGGFSQGMKAGAVVGTIFAPFVSVVVAMVMLGSETNPVRRSFLKTWAAISGALLVLWFVIVLAVASSFSHSGPSTNGPCIGGPVIGAPGEQIGPHRYRFPCEGGGSSVVRLP
jgi:hypothetical protein